MDADEIRTLLGENIFERAKKYRKRIQQSTCTVNEDGVRHLSAVVQGKGGSYYYTQAWLRENGSFVSASCNCPYNENGEGTYCKHIGALLLEDAEQNAPAPAPVQNKPDAIPGVTRGAAGLNAEPPRKDSYASGLEMLFGRKWHGDAPTTDYEARRLLDTYKEAALENLGVDENTQRTGFAHLEPELTLVPGAQPWLRLRISDGGGRQYVVKSIPDLLENIEHGRSISYGKALAFVHRWDAFDEESRALLQLLRRLVSARQSMDKAAVRVYGGAEQGPAGGTILTGEIFDALVQQYEHTGLLGGYELREGLPTITLTVERRRGGVQVEGSPALASVQGLDYDYLFSETTLWRMQRPGCTRLLPALQALGGKSLFFTSADATAFWAGTNCGKACPPSPSPWSAAAAACRWRAARRLPACRALTTITCSARRPSGGCSGPAAPVCCLHCRHWAAKACSSPVLTPRPSAAMCCRSWATSSTLWTRNACC